jgi:hypothetical protein
MLAHGFTTEMLVRVVRDGLASVKAEHIVAGGQRLEIARAKIRAAGGKALAGTFAPSLPQFWRLPFLLYLSELGAKPQRRA